MNSDVKITLTNSDTVFDTGRLSIKPTQKEISRLRSLADKYAEIAQSRDMQTKKRQWKACQSLRPERPMLIFETQDIVDYISADELVCQNEYLRNTERWFLHWIKHYSEVGDDLVFEPYYRLPWLVNKTDYGIDIVEKHAKEQSMAYLSEFPLNDPDDIKKLKNRQFSVDRERSLDYAETMRGIFGDILPVYVGGISMLDPNGNLGFTHWLGAYTSLLTQVLFKFMGFENMSYWMYDYPDELRYIIEYLSNDELRLLDWLEAEGLTTLNTDDQTVSATGYGYVDELPAVANPDAPAKLADMWGSVTAQETVVLSPNMVEEWIYPYLSKFGRRFGLTSYGCCEPIHDRFDKIAAALPNLRVVSVTAWCNVEKAAELLGKKYVFQRKPNPAFVSNTAPDWAAAKEDMERTWACVKDSCCTEFFVRDVYNVGSDNSRPGRWVEMAKRVLGL